MDNEQHQIGPESAAPRHIPQHDRSPTHVRARSRSIAGGPMTVGRPPQSAARPRHHPTLEAGADLEPLRSGLSDHFVMWRELDVRLGPPGEWFCACGATFGFSDTAIDHQAAALAPLITQARAEGRRQGAQAVLCALVAGYNTVRMAPASLVDVARKAAAEQGAVL